MDFLSKGVKETSIITIITRKVVIMVVLAEEKMEVGSTCLDFIIKAHLSDLKQSLSLTKNSVKC